MKRMRLIPLSKATVYAGLFCVALTAGCAQQMKPARVIPTENENARLCKQTYLQCRGHCGGIRNDSTRMECADQCERDVDTCLIQPGSPRTKDED